MKKSWIISCVTITTLSLIGCGGGGGDAVASSKIGTGYYVDSAVAGVNYTCGSQTGVTDKDGKFNFEEGKDCKFKVADLILKKVPAENLVNNGKVMEDNITVARFLLSLDTDGNPNNGIQITDRVKTSLKETIQAEKIKNITDATTKLDNIVNYITPDIPHPQTLKKIIKEIC